MSQPQSGGVVYTTETEILPEMPRGIPVTLVEVEDPLEPGVRARAWKNVRGDPLARLILAGSIDKAQFEAGQEMRGYYERAEIGAIQAIDTTKEAVDGGKIPEPLTETVQKAMKQIARLEKILGQEGSALIRDVLVKGMFLREIAAARDIRSERGQRYIARRFRECLETLARELHYA